MSAEPVDLFDYEVAHSLIPGSSDRPSYSEVLVALQDALYDRDLHAERWKKSLEMMDALKDKHIHELSSQQDAFAQELARAREDRNEYKKFFFDTLGNSSEHHDRLLHEITLKSRLNRYAGVFLGCAFTILFVSRAFEIRFFSRLLSFLIVSIPSFVLSTLYDAFLLSDRIEKARWFDIASVLIATAFMLFVS